MALVAVSPIPATDGDNHAGRYLADYWRDSALHPKRRERRSLTIDVEYETSAGPQTVRRATGLTTAVEVDSRAKTATISGADYRERMRRSINLPVILGDSTGLNASWLVSYACFQAGVRVSPRPDYAPSTYIPSLWWPMHGSLMPMIGRSPFGEGPALGNYNGSASYQVGGTLSSLDFDRVRPTFVEGPFCLGAYAHHVADNDRLQVQAVGYVDEGAATLLGTGAEKGRVQMWLRGDAIGTTTTGVVAYVDFSNQADPSIHVHVGVASDRRVMWGLFVTSAYTQQFFGPTVPDDGEWHFVGVSWDFTGVKVIEFRMDETDSTSNPVFVSPLTGETTSVSVASLAPIADVHIGYCDTTEPWLNDIGFVQEAFIDQSELELDACALPEPIETWQLVTDLAAAEQAVAYWTEAGEFLYRTRGRLVDDAGQTVQVTLTDDTALTDLTVDRSIDRVRNVITATYARRRAVSAQATLWELQESEDGIRFPKGSTTDYVLPFADPAWSVRTTITNSSVALSYPNSYLIFNSKIDGNGSAMTSELTVSANGFTAGAVVARITNISNRDAYLIAGKIFGFAISVDAETTVSATDATSVIRWGPQPLALSSSEWVQTPDTAEAIASLVLADTAEPRAVVTGLSIVGDPRLQLGDRVSIVDTSGTRLDGEYWLSSISNQFGAASYTQTCVAREATSTGLWDTDYWDDVVWG
jgi:hypothetical protein